MNEHEVKAIAEEAGRAAAKKAHEQLMLLLGVNIKDADAVLKHQADMQWVRNSRTGSIELGKLVKRSAIGVAITALALILWYGVKQALNQ